MGLVCFLDGDYGLCVLLVVVICFDSRVFGFGAIVSFINSLVLHLIVWFLYLLRVCVCWVWAFCCLS